MHDLARYTAPGYPNYYYYDYDYDYDDDDDDDDDDYDYYYYYYHYHHLLDGHCEVLRAALHTVDRRKGAIGGEVAARPEYLAIVAHSLALGVVRLARAVVNHRAQRLGVASTQ